MGDLVGKVAGGLVGGLFGDDGGGQQQTTSSEPWGPAQPWIKENIDRGRQLQGFYEQNPFNPIQQTGYQNLFGDMDNFRNNIAPGLMGVANKMIGANYQRAPAGTELGASNPYASGGVSAGIRGLQNNYAPNNAGQIQPGLLGGMTTAAGMKPQMMGGSFRDLAGLLSEGQQGAGDSSALASAMQGAAGIPQPMNGGSLAGLLSSGLGGNQNGGLGGAIQQASSGPFSTGGGQSFGQINWDLLNPYKNELKPAEKKPGADELSDDEKFNRRLEQWMKENDPGYAQRREIWRSGDGGS